MEASIEPHPQEADVSYVEPPGRTISGFWRRLLAFLLDSLALGILGFILGLFLFDLFAQFGGWGRLLGFCVALAYFAALNSSLGNGQTIGKRIMKIEVADRHGAHISLGRSAVRYMFLGTPFFLNGAMVPPSLAMSPIGYIMVLIVFGMGGAIVYLYIFNRRTRQSLHDLFVGTFVLRKAPNGPVRTSSVWKPHLVIVGVWFLIVIGLSMFIPRLTQKGIFPELFAIQKSIYSSGKVHTATAFVGKTWTTMGGKTGETSFFQSNATWKEQPADYEAAANQIAAIILSEYPDIMQKDILTVTVTYGYDIGIAHVWKNRNSSHSPQEWQQILDPSKSQL